MKKGLMLCREPRLYSCQRLKQAVEKAGMSLDILDPNRMLLKLNNGQFELWYQPISPSGKPQVLPAEKLPDYAFILPRFGTSSTEMGCRVLRHFELQQIPVLNRASAFEVARDKWQSLQQLAAQQIPIPNTVLGGALFNAQHIPQQFHFPTVIKTLSGSQGVGVVLAESQGSAVSLLETLQSVQIETIVQAFIQESRGRDVRAFVIGDRVVASMQRLGEAHEFRANIHRGGRAEKIALSIEEQQLAVRATKALGLDVAGVDLIRAEQGYLVLEVNASPGLEMIEQVSQVDIASQMITYLQQTYFHHD